MLLCVNAGLAQSASDGRYAEHSVLANGTWVKIKVPETGIYELSDSLLRAAGFTTPSRVKVYGYGGALQPEQLTTEYIARTDDLSEVPTTMVAGRRLFFAVGPVNWSSPTDAMRIRNFYSDYGCYFLTDDGGEPLMTDSSEWIETYGTTTADYHSLYEVDDYAWYYGGRNLFERQWKDNGDANVYELMGSSEGKGELMVVMSYKGYCSADVLLNDSLVGSIVVSEQTTASPEKRKFPDKYSVAATDQWKFSQLDLLDGANSVTIKQTQGEEMHLDYIVLTSEHPRSMPDLATAEFPLPQIAGTVANQDLHSHDAVDMVIVLPSSALFMSEALRLKQMHETLDGMTVGIVTSEQLYNEFSSGTPDANACRRYLKMMYDRSGGESPRFLLLFGKSAWDNRMHCSDWSNSSPDDYLLCYESDNSLSETDCYVSDDYFCLLDDNDGGNILRYDKGDVAVGRLPALSADDARVMVDKIISYRNNNHAGAWQNIICLLGDDGNANLHMQDAEEVYKVLKNNYECYNIKKFYWDAYSRVTNSLGNTYPDLRRHILQQMQDGALIIDYSGHGTNYNMSHENVLQRADFATETSLRLPMWVTASCDIMPFDMPFENIGQTAMLNPKGGAVAFFGTTRTVYAQHNRPMNKGFMKYVLATDSNGRRYTIGEAVRMAKNDLTTGTSNMQSNMNKMHYALFGDPALTLIAPELEVVIDSINGVPASEGVQRLPAGSYVRVSGHVESDGDNFQGVATLTVLDAEQTITCHMNRLPSDEMPKSPLVFQNRLNTIFVGSDSIRNGSFMITFAVPKDILYSEGTGLLQVYAVDTDHTLTAHGECDSFTMCSADEYPLGGDGPTISCYLDSRLFVDSTTVGPTPFFYAELYDEDGINTSDGGIGHNLELMIDGQMGLTYSLNSSFVYDFGDYRRGTVGFTLPELTEGVHQLQFRAWDVLNNSTTAVLHFVVDPNYKSPAVAESLTQVMYDRYRTSMQGSVYDAAGRYVGTQVPRRAGIYIFRSPSGVVKKISVSGNN